MHASRLRTSSVIGICILIIVGFTTIFPAMAPELEWSKTYGGNQSYRLFSLQQTSDKGNLMAGSLRKADPDWYDALLVKTDQSGAVQWTKTYGGNHSNELLAVQQSSDGGYVAVGSDYNGSRFDYYLLKVDSDGNMQWNKTYGDGSYNVATSVQQTLGGGFIIAGFTSSSGDRIIWLVKTDLNGNMMWNKTYPGASGSPTSYISTFVHAEQTLDKGYIISGVTRIGSDPLLIKTDETGNIEWNNTYGESGVHYMNYVMQALDGGYVMAGRARSGIWLVKTYPNGSMQWGSTYGESHSGGYIEGYYVGQTRD